MKHLVKPSYFRVLVTMVAAVLAASLAASFLLLAKPTQAQGTSSGAIVDSSECRTNTLPANDDGSTDAVPLPHTLNFFGADYNSLYVNNNGNVTFDSPLSTFTPFDLASTDRVIIAPFFADVDTRGTDSGLVTYGSTTFGGRDAFCVDWVDVGYYSSHTDKKNSFQLLLVDRSDVAAGDFDIVFNYDKIEWETGDASSGSGGLGGNSARVGYSNGGGFQGAAEVVREGSSKKEVKPPNKSDTSKKDAGSASSAPANRSASTAAVDGVSFELPGSAVNGSFLDSNPSGLIHSSRGSLQLGRYVFSVRNGTAPTGGTISGKVFKNSSATGNELEGALVQVCESDGSCNTTSTSANGQYSVSGLADGSYRAKAFPPSSSSFNPAEIGPLTLAGGQTLSGQDIVLTGPTPIPDDTTITNRGTTADGVPIVYWGEPLTLTTQDIAGGSARFEIILNGDIIRSGNMIEGPPGTYTGTTAPLIPQHGNAQIRIIVTPPNGTPVNTTFDVYIDPSGNVRTVGGAPIEGATVTLLRSDSETGPFEAVPNGNAVMSPSNRTNPDTTDAAGHFGWDVIAGFYKVRAEKAGCTSPSDSSQAFVESQVMTIPPPVTNLDLRLNCGAEDTTPPTVTSTSPSANATGVLTTDKITATFSKVMDPDTLRDPSTQTSKTVLLKLGKKKVPATVSCASPCQTVTLTPLKPLKANKKYKVTISTAAKSLGGIPLDQNPNKASNQGVSWTFTTGRT